MHCLRLCLYRKCYGHHVRENIHNKLNTDNKFYLKYICYKVSFIVPSGRVAETKSIGVVPVSLVTLCRGAEVTAASDANCSLPKIYLHDDKSSSNL